ncbi:hypothetical protein L596_025964 [Steinernema carpocapsae]|uniref:Reverse transcriptase zinc-binding domain-containing protein n=1 Tax=Steinernema carpocapsae TaxID=34508 RepID=A0A4U5M9A3_STECR|nr:hypothetical protein L596_025964 [Steinernema carpocapsae]
MGLHFNPTKTNAVKAQSVSLDDEGTYTYLGIQLGVHSRTKVSGILSQGVRDAEIICSSQLAPWQKINALKTFIYPRYSFFIRNGDPLLSDLKAFDNSMSAMIKELIHCPNKGTSRHYLYGDARKGGLGVPSLVDEYHVSSVACLTRLLFSKDKTVAEYFNGEFSRLVSKWMKTMRMQHPDATPVDRVDFLNCSERFDGRLASTESHSLWTRMRRSTRHLRKFLGTFEFLLLENDVLGLRWIASPRVIDLSKSNASQLLRRLVNHRHIQTMVTEMKSQGKVLAAVSRSDHSTKFLRDGLYVSFSTYKWIHRARLNLHLLNGSNFKGLDQSCRRCGERETLPHVLQHCKQAMTLITKRHNAVQTRLINAIPKKAGRIITSNVPIPGISSNRPDIVVTDTLKKEAIIIDVTIPFENGHSALHEAFERKVVKYEPEKKRLESQGYKVTLTAFVVGSLGTWFGRNSHCLKVLEVRRAYTRKMIPLMLSETAEYSKDIFWKHILADKYKIPANRYFNTTGHKPKTPEKSPTRAKPLPDLKRSRPPTNTPATVSKKRPRTFSDSRKRPAARRPRIDRGRSPPSATTSPLR